MSLGIGIALEPSVVRAACVERTRDQIRLLSVEEQSFDPAQADAQTRALAALRQALRIRQPVFLGLPSATAFVTTLHPLIVNQSRASLAAQFELEQQLPFKASGAAWHHLWMLAINGESEVLAHPPRQALQSARRLPNVTAVVAATKQETLNERLVTARRAGLSVSGVSVASLALLNACALQRLASRAKSLTILNLPGGAAAEWVLWSPEGIAAIPVGASSAETLPQELAGSWQSIQAQWPGASPAICLVGPASAADGAQSALAAFPNLQFQRFDPAQVVAMRSVRQEIAERSTAAIGLALQAVALSKFPINMLSSVQSSSSRQRIRRASLGVSAAASIAALGLAVSGMTALQKQKAQMLKSFEVREQRYQQLRPQVRTLLQRQQRLERLIIQLQGLAGAAPLMPETLARLAGALPETVWLTKCEIAQNAGLDIVLEGRAPGFQEVTQFIDKLKALPDVASVKPLSTTVMPASAEAKEMVNFSIQIQKTGRP